MAIAQQTSILLLDEPTTYLDPPHQVEILQLVRRLNKETGMTIVMVLHDITLASLYADRLIGLKDGHPIFATQVGERLRAESIEELFNMRVHAIDHPTADRSIIVPRT